MTLNCFAPHVRKQLEEIIKRGKIGLCPGPIKILKSMPSAPLYASNTLCDRFNIIIPYGGHFVDWFVMFQTSDPKCFPDFILGETFPVMISDVRSLVDYDPSKSDSFFIVLQELLRLYHRSQVALIKKYSRVHFEYSTLIQQTNLEEEDIEVHITGEKGPFSFLINLTVSFKSLPSVFKSESGNDKALLLVTFNDPEGTKIITKLCLPPKIELALGSPLSFRIPILTSDGCLMDYIPFVESSLKKRINYIQNNFSMRKSFLRLFIFQFEGCFVEYDRELALSASIVLEQNDFFFLLHMDIPQNFPYTKPSFTYKSVYHFNFERPYSALVNRYVYNPNWSPNILLQKVIEFACDYSELFKKDSVRNGLSL